MNFAQKQSLKIFISSFIILFISLIIIYKYNYNTILKDHLELSENIANEISFGLEKNLLEKVKTIRAISVTPVILKSLDESNEHYGILSEQIRDKKIQSQNEKWKSIEDNNNSFIQKFTNNTISQFLKNLQNNLKGEYGEIFITNKYGAIIASTAKLTTFAHGNKYWWQGAYNNGDGAVFFDDRGYDESVGGYVLGVVIPIKEGNEIIGILKANLNILGSVSEMITNFTKGKTEILKLIRSGGLIIFEEGKEPLSERVSTKLLGKFKTDESSFKLEANGKEWIVGISEISITSGNKAYKFGGSFESIGHKKGNNGESWYIVDYHPISHIVEPAKENLKVLLIIGFFISFLLAFSSFIIGRRAAKPIRELIKQTKQISKGDFDSKVSIKRNDEIGFLAASFNKMVQNLKRTTTSIDKLGLEIKERQKAEEAMRKSKEKYYSLFSNLLDGFAFHKIVLNENNEPIDYIFIEINEAFEKQTGLKKEKIIGKKVTEVLPGIEHDSIGWIDIYGKVALTGKAIRFENFSEAIKKWYSVVAYSTRKNYFAAIFEDITERKQAEKLIDEKSEEQKKQFEKSEKQRIASLVVLNDLNKITKNLKLEIKERERAEQIQKVLYNISNAVIITKNLEDLISLIQKELGAIIDSANFYIALYDNETDMFLVPLSADEKEDITSFPAGKSFTNYVLKTQKPLLANKEKMKKMIKAGDVELVGTISEIWLGVPLKIEGKVTGVLAVQSYIDEFAYDESDKEMLEFIAEQISISIDRKKSEETINKYSDHLEELVKTRTEELSIANTELAKASRLKDEFLANMSHELRTPLNAVLGLSEALQEGIYGDLNPKQIEKTQNIAESGRHLLELINEILDLAKIEAGKIVLEYQEIKIENLVQSSLRFIKQLAFKKGIKVSSSISGKLEIFRADEKRMKQILVNLLSNAVKFTPEGGKIGLDVNVNDDNKTISFVVWDTGIGIEPEHFDKLFKPFVQIDSKLSRQYEGTGLGLALVQNLTELHSGSINFGSEKGKGSRFVVTIPIMEYVRIYIKPYTEFDDSKIDKIETVLIIEDSPVAADQTYRYLEEINVKSLVQSTGKGAIKKINQVKPDLIIMDILLPEIDGWEIIEQIKKNIKTEKIPIIICSIVDEKERGKKLGVNAYIVKPFTRKMFIKTFSEVTNLELLKSDVLLTDENNEDLKVNKPNILLAEDNEQNIITIKDYLEAKQFEVNVVRNGKEAIEMVEEMRPEVILMDIQMPVLNGLEAIKLIRKNKETEISRIPIIALTALAMPGDRKKCLNAGADEYIKKPVGLKYLVKTINEFLEKKA